jgi:hypothetical protein
MNYSFFSMGRTDNDVTDKTQKNISNVKYGNYVTSDLFSNNDTHVKFATQQPVLLPNGMTFGEGIPGRFVDVDSQLSLKKINERVFGRNDIPNSVTLEKLSLQQRLFTTVPYLGKGFSNPVLESQLMTGEPIHSMKSVGTVTEQSFLPLSLYPVSLERQQGVLNVEDVGGKNTRIYGE